MKQEIPTTGAPKPEIKREKFILGESVGMGCYDPNVADVIREMSGDHSWNNESGPMSDNTVKLAKYCLSHGISSSADIEKVIREAKVETYDEYKGLL